MADDFKQFELERWQASVEQYDTSFGGLTRQTIPRILDVLGVQKGTRLVDIACGPGYLAAEASRRGGMVVGVDFSAAMVEKAKTYHPRLTFKIGDAENLTDFTGGSFDAVGMNFGILHLANPERAVREMHRVLVKGGRAALTVWRPPEEAIGFAIVLKAIQEHGDPAIALPQGPAFFKYSELAICEQLLSQGGFTAHVEPLPLVWKLRDPDELFTAFYHGTARTGGLLRRQKDADLAKIRAAVRQAATAHTVGGEVVLPMPAQLAWGVRV